MGVAVAVLNPQDCLKQPFSRKALISPPPTQTKHLRNPNNPNPKRSSRAQPNRRARRSPNRSNESSARTERTAGAGPTVEKPANRLVNGSVKILKRGEDLRETTPDPPSPGEDRSSAGVLGPDPESAQKQGSRDADLPSSRADGFYAGSSAFIMSPPPSSLPLPAFFARKSDALTNSEATCALMRILRLDLQ